MKLNEIRAIVCRFQPGLKKIAIAHMYLENDIHTYEIIFKGFEIFIQTWQTDFIIPMNCM